MRWGVAACPGTRSRGAEGSAPGGETRDAGRDPGPASLLRRGARPCAAVCTDEPVSDEPNVLLRWVNLLIHAWYAELSASMNMVADLPLPCNFEGKVCENATA